MDLKRALELEKARTDYLEVTANRPEVRDIKKDPVVRYRAMQSVLEKLVGSHPHEAWSTHGPRKTPSLLIARTEGPLPNIRLQMCYTYSWGWNGRPEERADYNEFNEHVTAIMAVWMHKPDNNRGFDEPSVSRDDTSKIYIEGEVFAVETVSLLSLKNGGRYEALDVVEQSIEVYVGALEALKVPAAS